MNWTEETEEGAVWDGRTWIGSTVNHSGIVQGLASRLKCQEHEVRARVEALLRRLKAVEQRNGHFKATLKSEGIKMARDKRPVWITSEAHAALKSLADAKGQNMKDFLSTLLLREAEKQLDPKVARKPMGGVWVI